MQPLPRGRCPGERVVSAWSSGDVDKGVTSSAPRLELARRARAAQGLAALGQAMYLEVPGESPQV